MKTTKIINAKQNDGPKDIQELIKYFGTYCISSSEEIAQDIQTFTDPLELAAYIDTKQKQGFISDVFEPEHIDYTIVQKTHQTGH
ncbi:hypothetical protein [Sulfurimonas sp.]|uniref:hypothetical protein n=1 Tax=Sulfurimonas sp. TaxID=2022749 RepID=UPI0025E5F61D|nr:hypothetical protein [Sulfurimonas sp.]MBW6489165.1 hypothetical protein [Sulfurimonas sp.]